MTLSVVRNGLILQTRHLFIGVRWFPRQWRYDGLVFSNPHAWQWEWGPLAMVGNRE